MNRRNVWLAGMRLSTKALLLSVVLVSALILGSFYGLSVQIRQQTKQLLQDLLNRTEQQVTSIKEENLRQLFQASMQLTNNPTLRAAIETSRLEAGATYAGPSATLLATVANETDKVWLGLGHDLLIVTDATGRVLAANSEQGPPLEPAVDVSWLPTLSHALDPAMEVGEGNSGVIRLQGQHYLVSSLPMDMQGYIIGSLTLGDRIDGDFLPNLRAFFGGEIMVVANGQLIATSLPANLSSSEGMRKLAILGGAALDDEGLISVGSEEFLVTSMRLGEGQEGGVSLFLLRSLTLALNESEGALKGALARQALLAIVIAALLAWLATRASLRPLERFMGFMRRVADTGDYSLRFESRRAGQDELADYPVLSGQPGNELQQVEDALNGMLAVIEERDGALKSAHARLETTVSELQQKDSELRHLQKMEAIGLLAGGVAHDFNNILQVVTGFSDLALRKLGPEHEASEFIGEVLKAGQSASMLTRQLLALSSRQLFNPKVININRVINEMEKILRKVVGESIELTTLLAPDLHNVLADPAQVEQILLNLTVNARDAIEGNGHMCVRTRNCGPESERRAGSHPVFESDCVIIEVEDDGCGMDEVTRERIFDPFFTTKEQGKGTGLGLSTVHAIVRQCGGLVQVESAPGRGAVFRVILPAVKAEVDDEKGQGEEAEERGSETILLVEDDAHVRKLLRKMLTISGYHVLEASGPDEALSIVDGVAESIDLMVTDVIMPGMNGRELQERVVRSRPNIQTLFISGYAAGVIDDVGIRAKGLNFLQKPFTPDALVRKVKDILETN